VDWRGKINFMKIEEETAWNQLVGRDKTADFLYAVSTTGVFCRIGCASRLPRRENVRFFSTAGEAQAEGFRPCQRCHPNEDVKSSAVADMCAYIEKHSDRTVSLAELGKLTKMSPFTAQRNFKAAMGVTPSQYQRALRANLLRSQLSSGACVTDAIYEAGYGSSSRAYEHTPLGMTPRTFAAGGRGERIGFAVSEAPSLGWIIVGSTARGICWLALGESAADVEAGLRSEFPAAKITQDPSLADKVGAVLRQLCGASADQVQTLPLDLRGTAFQLRVWSALQQIPVGQTRSYSALAREIGCSTATRAVARACATNRVAIIVPCHRVVGLSGSLTGYRWGIDRKRQLLISEKLT
jgi:AraC family transcriptional regulator of adaptative response/methylated-DNA-[protein]-cysteine methyltransferase